jgi:ABC-type lipoprotein release transport system permease subunit
MQAGDFIVIAITVLAVGLIAATYPALRSVKALTSGSL